MFIQFFKPHPLLQDIVSNVMIYRNQYDKGTSPPINLFPAIPEHSLYFYPRDPLTVHRLEDQSTLICPPAIMVGPQVGRVNLSMGHDHVVVRVALRTGGLHRLLGVPMYDLVDYTCNTEDFFKGSVREVNERLAETDDVLLMKSVVEDFLIRSLRKAKPPERLDRAMDELMKSAGNISIDYLAKESCLSVRQFERKCKDRIGLSPKLFARIARFSKAYRLRELRPDLTWTSITHMAGYFDQMHLIRDFKVFTGVLPSVVDKELSQTPGRLQADIKI